MILFVLVISAFMFFLCYNLLIKSPALHVFTSLLFLVIFLGSTVMVTLNFHNHWGMKKVTTEKTTKLVSSLPQGNMNVLMYQPIGTSGKDNVFIYRTNAKSKTMSKTGVDKFQNHVVVTNNSPKLVTKKVRYEYKSSMTRFWFGMAQKPSRVKTINYFYVPKNWMRLTVKQVKSIPSIMKKLSAKNQAVNADKMKIAGQQYVQAMLMQAMKQNPKMTSSQKQAVIKKATADFKSQAQQKAMDQMMPALKEALNNVK
jgi:hypothetical protein